jgi:hypothetical protein
MHLIAIAALILAGVTETPARCPAQPPRNVSAREMTNEELIAALRLDEQERVTKAVAEVARRGEIMVPLLASLKGCRGTFFGGGLGNPMSAQVIPQTKAGSLEPIPLEQAALYLIVGIYRGSLSYAQSPYLVDLREPEKQRTASVSPRLNERAWQAVDRWIARWRESNVAELRRRGQDPLAGSKVAFW